MQKHGYVYNKSSLDVIGMFLEMVRSRFVQPDNTKFPWQWNADDKKSRIVIEEVALDKVVIPPPADGSARDASPNAANVAAIDRRLMST